MIEAMRPFFKINGKSFEDLKLDPKSKDDVEKARKILRESLKKRETDTKKKELNKKLYNFLHENLKKGIIQTPKWVKEAKEKAKNKTRRVSFKILELINSIIDLWVLGYDDLEFLGCGAQGLVMKDNENKKAIKLTSAGMEDEEIGLDEEKEEKVGPDEEIVRKLNDIFKNDPKAKKYIMNIECVNFRNIYEMPLGKDFNKISIEKSRLKPKKYDEDDEELSFGLPIKQSTDEDDEEPSFELSRKQSINEKRDKKHIENLLAHARSLMKAVIALHSKGFAHNDIKPDNLMKVPKDIDAKKYILKDEKYYKQKSNTIKKVHKNKLVLADFGTISSIKYEEEHPDEFNQRREGVAFHITPELETGLKHNKLSIEKRDVWLCGFSLFMMLVCEDQNAVETADEVTKMAFSSDEDLWSNELQYIYYEKDKDNVINFVHVIQKMLQKDVEKRCTDQEAYDALKELKA